MGKEKKEFIIYRKDYSGIISGYYKKELTREELKDYISKECNRLENIDVYKIEDKINVNIDISININKDEEKAQSL